MSGRKDDPDHTMEGFQTSYAFPDAGRSPGPHVMWKVPTLPQYLIMLCIPMTHCHQELMLLSAMWRNYKVITFDTIWMQLPPDPKHGLAATHPLKWTSTMQYINQYMHLNTIHDKY